MKGLVLCLAVAVLACGSKKNAADSKAIDNYVNVDLAPHLAKVVAARSAYGDVKATDIDEQPDKMKWLFRDVAAPFLSQAVAGASAITPPPAAKELHEAALSLWKKERDIINAMAAATDPIDAEKFKAAHAQIMDLQESVNSFDRRLQALLDNNGGLKLKPLPDVKIPDPKLDEPPAPAAGSAEVVAGGAAGSAEVTAKPTWCKAGTDALQDDGNIHCETEQMFSPPEIPATTPKDHVVVCGPGRLVVGKDGKVVSCVASTAFMVGKRKFEKGVKVTFGYNASVSQINSDAWDGCFDETGQETECM